MAAMTVVVYEREAIHPDCLPEGPTRVVSHPFHDML